jgi:hypothetical protein
MNGALVGTLAWKYLRTEAPLSLSRVIDRLARWLARRRSPWGTNESRLITEPPVTAAFRKFLRGKRLISIFVRDHLEGGLLGCEWLDPNEVLDGAWRKAVGGLSVAWAEEEAGVCRCCLLKISGILTYQNAP